MIRLRRVSGPSVAGAKSVEDMAASCRVRRLRSCGPLAASCCGGPRGGPMRRVGLRRRSLILAVLVARRRRRLQRRGRRRPPSTTGATTSAGDGQLGVDAAGVLGRPARAGGGRPRSTGAPNDLVMTSFDDTPIRVHWFPQPDATADQPAPTVLMGPGWGLAGRHRGRGRRHPGLGRHRLAARRPGTTC